MGQAAIPFILAASATSSAVGVRQSIAQGRAEKRQRQSLGRKQNRLEQEAQSKLDADKRGDELNRRRDMQRRRMRQRAGNLRGGTILTTPLGLPDEGSTILGG